MKPLLQATGRFTTPPGAAWRVFVCRIGLPLSLTHNERREKALRQISLSEERTSRRGALDVLFSMPPTHEFFLETSRLGIPQIIVRIPARIKGVAVNKDDHTVTSEAKQLRQLLSFWKALLVNDGRGRSADWRYVQPVTESVVEDEAEPFNAYHWWINALVSRYVSFFGVFEYPDRHNINPIPPPKKNSNDNGFTIVELLVVLIIIGTLAALALPAWRYWVERTRRIQVLTVFERIEPELWEYQAENGEWPPDETPGNVPQGMDMSLWPGPGEALEEPQITWWDYEHWGFGDGTCGIHLTWFGPNQQRDHISHERLGKTGEIASPGDDIVKIVSTGPCNEPKGGVR